MLGALCAWTKHIFGVAPRSRPQHLGSRPFAAWVAEEGKGASAMKPTNPPGLALGERAAASTAASAGLTEATHQQLEEFGANAKAAAETPSAALAESSVRSMRADSSPERCADCGHYLMAGREGHKCTARPEVKRAKTEAKESKAEARDEPQKKQEDAARSSRENLEQD